MMDGAMMLRTGMKEKRAEIQSFFFLRPVKVVVGCTLIASYERPAEASNWYHHRVYYFSCSGYLLYGTRN